MADGSAGGVWAVYDLYRSARVNVRYYAVRIDHLHSQKLAMNAVLAVSLPASLAAALWPSDSGIADALWKFFAAAAVLIVLSKPLLGSAGKIRKRRRALEEYRDIARELHRLTVRIRADKAYGPALQDEFEAIRTRHAAVLERRIEHMEDRRLKAQCEKEIEREFPREMFFVPDPVEAEAPDPRRRTTMPLRGDPACD